MVKPRLRVMLTTGVVGVLAVSCISANAQGSAKAGTCREEAGKAGTG